LNKGKGRRFHSFIVAEKQKRERKRSRDLNSWPEVGKEATL
jgi:hypothetical protein